MRQPMRMHNEAKPKPLKSNARGYARGSSARRAELIGRDVANKHAETERALLAARDPDALQRQSWRESGTTAAALRELTASFTGKRRLTVLTAGEDGLPESIAAPMQAEGPAWVWTRSGQTSGTPAEALYRLTWSLAVDMMDRTDRDPEPVQWADLPELASLEGKALHRLKAAQERASWTVEGEDMSDTSVLVLVGRPEGMLHQTRELNVCQRCRAPTDRPTEPCPPCRRAETLWHEWLNAERTRRGVAIRERRAATARQEASAEAQRLRHRADQIEKQFQSPPKHSNGRPHP